MSLLGEEPVEKRGYRNSAVSFKCPSERDDGCSCNDSGIDIRASQMDVTEQGLQDTYDNDPQSGTTNGLIGNFATEASTRGPWSVDEMIALSLLEAMESRGQSKNHESDSRDRKSIGRRRVSSMWRAIAKPFRKFRLA